MSYKNDNHQEKERLANLSAWEQMQEHYPGWADLIENCVKKGQKILAKKKTQLENKKNLIKKKKKKELQALKSLNKDEVFYLKEKYGHLDLTPNFNIPAYNEFDSIIMGAYEKSSETCEVCGKKGEVRGELPRMRTLCKKHYIKHLQAGIKAGKGTSNHIKKMKDLLNKETKNADKKEKEKDSN